MNPMFKYNISAKILITDLDGGYTRNIFLVLDA